MKTLQYWATCKGGSAGRGRHLSAALLVAILAASPAQAAELFVQGRVLNIEPLTSAGRDTGPAVPCRPAPTADRRSLTALLAWDLQSGCAPAVRGGTTINGYRVRYEWDGRVYTRVLPEPPGKTIPLRVRVH